MDMLEILLKKQYIVTDLSFGLGERGLHSGQQSRTA